MPIYEVMQGVWVLKYSRIKGIEAESGKEALQKAEDEGTEAFQVLDNLDSLINVAGWVFQIDDDNGDDSIAVSYESVDLNGVEVYQVNRYDPSPNLIEEFGLLHPKGWVHS